jgi:hypothetical protein
MFLADKSWLVPLPHQIFSNEEGSPRLTGVALAADILLLLRC